jgi:hypothetical protein
MRGVPRGRLDSPDLSPALPVLAVVLLAVPAVAQAPLPFELATWRAPGRVVDGFVARGEDGRETVFVISLDGAPPEDRRYVTALPRDLAAAARPVEMPRTAVAVDAAELGLAPGPELVSLSAHELRVWSLDGEVLARHALEPALPLPPRACAIGMRTSGPRRSRRRPRAHGSCRSFPATPARSWPCP